MVEHYEFEPWQRFSEWVHSICVVTFDLEVGQALEIIYPGDAELSTIEKTNICYLAFPDSNSGNNKDTNFHFRIRRHTCVLTEAQEALYLALPPSSAVDPCYLYGFVHFRQQKDPNIPRGYFQKSLVLLSVLPFVNLFSTVVEQIALQYFEVGEPAIEAGCHDLDCWPPPEPGVAYSLPLLGMTVHCRIPSLADFPYETRTAQQVNDFTASIVLPTIHQVDVYKALNTTLNNVQLLWELVLLGEPLLVMASGPARCSAVVQALISLISPLKYSNDFRPFFTIHDSEFKEFSHRERSPSSAGNDPVISSSDCHLLFLRKILPHLGKAYSNHSILAMNIAAGGLKNTSNNLGSPLCKYERLFDFPAKRPLGHCQMPNGTGKYNILVLGNSWASNQGPTMVYPAFKKFARKFDVFSVNGCEPLKRNKFCMKYPDYAKLAADYFKPDILFLLQRTNTGNDVHVPLNTTIPIEEDPVFKEYLSHLRYYEKYAKKIYIQQALPWCKTACTSAVVLEMKKRHKLLRDIGDGNIIHNEGDTRIRIAELGKRCKNCEIIDFLPYYSIGNNGKRVPYDLENNLILLDDTVHLNRFGKELIQPLFDQLAHKLELL